MKKIIAFLLCISFGILYAKPSKKSFPHNKKSSSVLIDRSISYSADVNDSKIDDSTSSLAVFQSPVNYLAAGAPSVMSHGVIVPNLAIPGYFYAIFRGAYRGSVTDVSGMPIVINKGFTGFALPSGNSVWLLPFLAKQYPVLWEESVWKWLPSHLAPAMGDDFGIVLQQKLRLIQYDDIRLHIPGEKVEPGSVLALCMVNDSQSIAMPLFDADGSILTFRLDNGIYKAVWLVKTSTKDLLSDVSESIKALNKGWYTYFCCELQSIIEGLTVKLEYESPSFATLGIKDSAAYINKMWTLLVNGYAKDKYLSLYKNNKLNQEYKNKIICFLHAWHECFYKKMPNRFPESSAIQSVIPKVINPDALEMKRVQEVVVRPQPEKEFVEGNSFEEALDDNIPVSLEGSVTKSTDSIDTQTTTDSLLLQAIGVDESRSSAVVTPSSQVGVESAVTNEAINDVQVYYAGHVVGGKRYVACTDSSKAESDDEHADEINFYVKSYQEKMMELKEARIQARKKQLAEEALEEAALLQAFNQAHVQKKDMIKTAHESAKIAGFKARVQLYRELMNNDLPKIIAQAKRRTFPVGDDEKELHIFAQEYMTFLKPVVDLMNLWKNFKVADQKKERVCKGFISYDELTSYTDANFIRNCNSYSFLEWFNTFAAEDDGAQWQMHMKERQNIVVAFYMYCILPVMKLADQLYNMSDSSGKQLLEALQELQDQTLDSRVDYLRMLAVRLDMFGKRSTWLPNELNHLSIKKLILSYMDNFEISAVLDYHTEEKTLYQNWQNLRYLAEAITKHARSDELFCFDVSQATSQEIYNLPFNKVMKYIAGYRSMARMDLKSFDDRKKSYLVTLWKATGITDEDKRHLASAVSVKIRWDIYYALAHVALNGLLLELQVISKSQADEDKELTFASIGHLFSLKLYEE